MINKYSGQRTCLYITNYDLCLFLAALRPYFTSENVSDRRKGEFHWKEQSSTYMVIKERH